MAYGAQKQWAAARTRETQLVPDVHAFPGHIACDDRTRSELVIPVIAKSGRVEAVLEAAPAAAGELTQGARACAGAPRR